MMSHISHYNHHFLAGRNHKEGSFRLTLHFEFVGVARFSLSHVISAGSGPSEYKWTAQPMFRSAQPTGTDTKKATLPSGSARHAVSAGRRPRGWGTAVY